jgi:hypothetical protein
VLRSCYFAIASFEKVECEATVAGYELRFLKLS